MVMVHDGPWSMMVHGPAVPLYTHRLNVKDIHFWDHMSETYGIDIIIMISLTI